jgi:hypothetical protein
MGEVPGAPPIAPGGAFEISFEAVPSDRLSFASMYVPSNDLFLSPRPAIQLYEDGEPVSGDVTETIGLFDAGTELNGEPGVDLPVHLFRVRTAVQLPVQSRVLYIRLIMSTMGLYTQIWRTPSKQFLIPR